MDKPAIRTIVAWPLGNGDYYVRPALHCKPDRTETLEHTADLVKLGFEAIIDPFDMEDMTRWEQLQRSAHDWRR